MNLKDRSSLRRLTTLTVNRRVCHHCGACVAACAEEALFLWDGFLEVRTEAAPQTLTAAVAEEEAAAVVVRHDGVNVDADQDADVGHVAQERADGEVAGGAKEADERVEPFNVRVAFEDALRFAAFSITSFAPTSCGRMDVLPIWSGYLPGSMNSISFRIVSTLVAILLILGTSAFMVLTAVWILSSAVPVTNFPFPFSPSRSAFGSSATIALSPASSPANPAFMAWSPSET